MAGFHCLGAAVHRQHHLHVGQLGELGAERPELIVVERAAYQRDPIELPARGRDETRMAMTEVERRVGGEHVHVPAAIDIGYPCAFGLGDHNRHRIVVVRAIRLAERPQLPGAARGTLLTSQPHAVLPVCPTYGRNSSVQHLGPPPACGELRHFNGHLESPSCVFRREDRRVGREHDAMPGVDRAPAESAGQPGCASPGLALGWRAARQLGWRSLEHRGHLGSHLSARRLS